MGTVIKIRCVDQVLTFDSTPVVASGGVGEDFMSFDFCPLWDGLARTAVFWRTEDEPYHVLLDDEDTCAIPVEVLAEPGTVYFGVFGVDAAGAVQRTSEVLRYNIVQGVITAGTKPSEPTQDIYQQILAKHAEILVALDPVEGMVKDATDAATTALAAAEDAQTRVAGAEEAATAAQASATAAEEAAAAAEPRFMYYSVNDFGCSMNSTMAEIWAALPAKSMLVCAAGGLYDPAWNFPQTQSELILDKRLGMSRGVITLHTKFGIEYRMVLNTDGTASGTWYKQYSEGAKPTAADVGALPLTGGTLTGSLIINYGTNSRIYMRPTSGVGEGRIVAQNNSAGLTHLSDRENSSDSSYGIYVQHGKTLKEGLIFVNRVSGSNTNYPIYGGHNWEAYGVAKIAVGNYTGNATTRTVEVGFRPKFVYIRADGADGLYENIGRAGLMLGGVGLTPLDSLGTVIASVDATTTYNSDGSVKGGGFTLPTTYFNVQGAVYYWAAFA